MKLLLGLIGLLFVVSTYSTYVGIIKKKNKMAEAFACIDVQLKKRYDLMPNLLTIAKKFMEHEKSLLEEVTAMRSQAMNLIGQHENIKTITELDKQISQKMERILVAVENYPQLKSDQTMMTTMQAYCEVEEHIAAARRFFNSAALELKNAVEIFPSSIIASILNIKSPSFFTITEQERQSVNASDYLK